MLTASWVPPPPLGVRFRAHLSAPAARVCAALQAWIPGGAVEVKDGLSVEETASCPLATRSALASPHRLRNGVAAVAALRPLRGPRAARKMAARPGPVRNR